MEAFFFTGGMPVPNDSTQEISANSSFLALRIRFMLCMSVRAALVGLFAEEKRY